MAKSGKVKTLAKPSARGGKRPGAGRKPGQGRYAEGTSVVRVPNSQLVSVNRFLDAFEKRVAATRRAATKLAGQMMLPLAEPPAQRIPLYGYGVAPGFPPLTEIGIEDRLDLNQLLVSNREATFFLRVSGDVMVGAGVHDGDIVVVNRTLEPVDGSVVVAVVDAELTVRRLIHRNGVAELHAENPKYGPIRLRDGAGSAILGVVTSAVHLVK